MNDHAARADRRPRRRRARRPHAQGGHSRRFVGADPAARSARHAGELRRRAEGRIAARLGRHHRARRHDLHGLARREPAALLPSRVVRQVHAVPRRHRLAAQDPRRRSSAAKGRCATSICSSSISGNIAGKTLCAFGDAAVTPVLTTLKHFRHEYEAHIREGRCTLPADWRARAAGRSALTIDVLDAVSHRADRPDALRLLHAAELGGRDGLRRAQGGGAAAAAHRAVSGRPARACSSRSPTSSS